MTDFKMVGKEILKDHLKSGSIIVALMAITSFISIGVSPYKPLVHVADYSEQNAIWKKCRFINKTAVLVFKMGIFDNVNKSMNAVQNEIDQKMENEKVKGNADTFMVAEYENSPAAYTIHGQLYNCKK